MKNLYTKIAFATLLAVPAVTFAASPFLKPVKDVLGDLEIFINFLNWALPALAVLVFFFLVIGFIASKMGWKLFGLFSDDAKNSTNLFWGLVGLAVMFAVYGLIQLLGALFGIDTNRAKTITAPSLPQVGGVRGGGYYNN